MLWLVNLVLNQHYGRCYSHYTKYRPTFLIRYSIDVDKQTLYLVDFLQNVTATLLFIILHLVSSATALPNKAFVEFMLNEYWC